MSKYSRLHLVRVFIYEYKVETLVQGNKNAIFTYGFDDQRRIMEYTMENGDHKKVYYLGDYEYVETNNGNKEIHYLNGVGGLNALYIINDDKEPTDGNIFYVAKDHLGSILALFDENNNIVDENSFDAWGRKRNPNNWSYDMSYKTTMTYPDLIDRGYTGHEHLEEFQLINMNGRMYDPITKQMTGPDILDLNPYSTQSYNRYAYCTNNPLKYTDPSGYVQVNAPVYHPNQYPNAQELDPNHYDGMAEFKDSYYMIMLQNMVDATVMALTIQEEINLILKTVTESGGGIIHERGKFRLFMEYMATNNKVEVAAYEVKKDGITVYYIQPWIGNTSEYCSNDPKPLIKLGYSLTDIVAQYHTHTDVSGIGWEDATFSRNNGIPIYVINTRGELWKYKHVGFDYPMTLPLGQYYGKTSAW